MLIPGFYTIIDFETPENQVRANIELNPDHEVYKGHFPGQPIVPGVIQLQIIKELLEKGLEKKLLLSKIISAKYYSMITPDGYPVLEISVQLKRVETGEYKITAQISRDIAVFTKVRAIFKVTNQF
ncbi:MAG: 3-hydroxyacyl-ACP dehydratase [Chlorobi bacterium]|nr:3-hydroxyacyl-ACP dehydratase [Chlorobiota bacterium]